MLIIQNIHIIDPLNQRNEIADITIDDSGRIYHIGKAHISLNDTVINGHQRIAYPGFVDVHVHFRDPGQTDKEDLLSGSQAAVAGGYTHVVCMANTLPIIDNVDLYLNNQRKMASLPLHVYQAAAITCGFKGQQLTDMAALKNEGVVMFTDDGIPLRNPEIVQEAMRLAASLDMPLSFHEEDPRYISHPGINDGIVSAQLGFTGAHRQAEIAIIERDIAFAKATNACINIQHISSKEAVDLVKKARQEGVNIHAEACPHHFTLNEMAVLTHGTLAKMNPPLRCEEDRLAICEALKEGTIDLIATDHAPHTSSEKAKPLLEAPSGILGLETAYALANEQLVHQGYLNEVSLIEKMAINPGKLIGIRCALDLNKEANIVIVDPHASWVVEGFHSKSQNSPFLGRTMLGQVQMTIAKGKIVYQKNI